MKLGLCYMVFDGIELLEPSILAIRDVVDYISVTYQSISYFGNSIDSNSLNIMNELKMRKLIDEILFYDTNLKIHHKENELNLRNLGLQASRNVGCTHHISADVDEFYKPEELELAKKIVNENNCDFSMVPYSIYYKDPTYLVVPEPKYFVTFINKINNNYLINKEFPFRIEVTRRLENYNSYYVFQKHECCMHHMSYVRKNIKNKIENSEIKRFYNIDKFLNEFNTYKLGDICCFTPDFINRRTTKVPNFFNIKV